MISLRCRLSAAPVPIVLLPRRTARDQHKRDRRAGETADNRRLISSVNVPLGGSQHKLPYRFAGRFQTALGARLDGYCREGAPPVRIRRRLRCGQRQSGRRQCPRKRPGSSAPSAACTDMQPTRLGICPLACRRCRGSNKSRGCRYLQSPPAVGREITRSCGSLYWLRGPAMKPGL
jgi:hypothetical protein